MLKLLADECIHHDLIEFLRVSSFDVLSAKEANISGVDDALVFNFSIKTKRTLLTFDRGFGDIFSFDIKNSWGIVIVLIGRMTKKEILQNTLTFLKSKIAQNLKGKLVIIGKKKVRIRSF